MLAGIRTPGTSAKRKAAATADVIKAKLKCLPADTLLACGEFEWRSSLPGVIDRLGAGWPPPYLAVTAAVEPTAMEGSIMEGMTMNVVTAKKAEPKREP